MLRHLAACLALGAAIAATVHAAGPRPARTLTAFSSQSQLDAFLKRYAGEQQARRQRRQADSDKIFFKDGAPIAPLAPLALSAPVMPSAAASVSGSMNSLAAESVTNNQSAGVDEGGIVKVHGRHLVMLRRGRLFTVDIEGDRLAPVAALDAYAPGADPSGSWYDEMIVSGDTVAVIGFSYRRGGTEIGLFDIDGDGHLSYRATYHMRSNDYYSSRNYASRQIGSKLIFYTPLAIDGGRGDVMSYFPAMRRWRPDATPADFRSIAPATRIYRSDEPLDPDTGLTLHTVTVCDLAARELVCEASAVLGPRGRVFYVSSGSVYVWAVTAVRSAGQARSVSGLFRLPLDGSAPSAIKVAGSPVDQFSFHESGDGNLNVLVRAQGRGESMWLSELGTGDLALLRLPLSSLADGRGTAPAASYRALPKVDGYALQNRFVGPWLLYGGGNGGSGGPALYGVRWDGAGDAQPLALAHRIERIDAMGSDAVVVGAAGSDLHFTSIALGREATLAGAYVRADAAQGETRSHGFFYKPERDGEGIVGLPIAQSRERGGPSVLYLRNAGRRLGELGSLASTGGLGGQSQDDGCRASCVDWYGNARPLFLRGRVFALMGYELVEGRVQAERLNEVRRVSFAPEGRR